uniref:condensation domain-containing protein n=1 Tax=Francisella sp. SYW-9 TaxID=2610888 RepID=UPI00123D407B
NQLSKVLPEYMMPSVLVKIESMPLTVNGKLDRKSLPDPEFVNEDSYVAPTTELEEKLCSIFAEVLGLEKVGITDDFFRIGGDSLLAVKVISSIKKILELSITVKDIFGNSTPAKLIKALASNGKNQELKLKARDDKTIVLTENQKSIMNRISIDNDITLYNGTYGFIINKNIKINIMIKAFKETVDALPLMKTLFIRNSQSTLIDINNLKLPISINRSFYNKNPNKQTLIDLLNSLSLEIFNLDKDVLWKACIYPLSENKYYLTLCFSRIISDGYSCGIFLKVLFNNYDSLLRDEFTSPDKQSLNYFDYASREQRSIKEGKYSEQINYWKSKYKYLPCRHLLGVELNQRPLLYGPANIIRIELDELTTWNLRNYSKGLGISPYSIFFSVWSDYLQQTSGKQKISVTCYYRNRDEDELKHIHGPFTNSIPILIDFPLQLGQENKCIKTSLLRVSDSIHEGISNSVPYGLLLDSIGIEKELQIKYNGYPLTQTFVNFPQPYSDVSRDESYRKDISMLSHTKLTSELDIGIILFEDKNNYSIGLIYRPELFSYDFSSQTAENYIDRLKRVCCNSA